MASKDNTSSATGTAPSAGTGESNSNNAPVVRDSAPPSKAKPEYEKVTEDGQDFFLFPLNDMVNIRVPVKEVGKIDLPTPYVKLETVG